MKHDFETIVDRSRAGSFKWDEMKAYPNTPAGTIPLSVADMEFKNAPEIVEGLKEYLDTMILGYTGPTDEYYQAIIGWMERRHGYSPKKEWFVTFAGIVSAIRAMVAAYTAPTDAVLITTPVYAQFRGAAEFHHRAVVENPLIEKDGEYFFDFADFEAKAKRPDVTLYIMCSPHNPTGHVWTAEEVHRIAEICYENGVFIVSDEIHSDLLFKGQKHTSMMTLEEKYRDNCAVCTSPSKTFNLAGMQASNIFISDAARREKMMTKRSSLNALSYQAARLAYTECDGWYEEMLDYVEQNADYLIDFCQKRMPFVGVKKPEGTYLIWLDFRKLGLSREAQETLMKEKAHAFFDEGWIFGDAGEGFERINLACPRRVLAETMERVASVIDEERAAGRIKL